MTLEEQFLKLKVMGYIAYKRSNSMRIDEIHFVHKKFTKNYESDIRMNPMITDKASFIYDLNLDKWTKARHHITNLTEAEKILYGKG